MDYPRLRPLNVYPVQMSGQALVCLQDPQNISEKVLFLPPALYFIVSHFDGKHSILDIQTEYMRQFGELLFSEKIEEVIQQLDENLFLEGSRFQDALREKEEGFRRAPFREAVFAGKSYDETPEELRLQIKGYFEGADGPGALNQRGESERVRGLVVPHIDFQRGGYCYAFAHRELWAKGSSHSFIIFGTAHTPMQQPFCLTHKDFVTPLGRLGADHALIDAIQSRCDYDLFSDEIVHRTEHSIEFQCVFLRFLIPEPAPLKIVPILSGSLHEAILKGISPREIESIHQFLHALKESVRASGENVCVLASADLAHLGLPFGDPEGLEEYDLRVLADKDEEMLSFVTRMDAEGFFHYVSREGDRRRICGLPAIYAMLNVLDAREGKLLKYGQAYTAETRSVVSFASLAFYGNQFPGPEGG